MGKLGWAGVGVLIISVLLAVVPFVVQLVGGDQSRYGVVPLPGSGTVTLPAEEVAVFFRESGIVHEDDSAHAPGGFAFTVVPEGGGPALDVASPGFFAPSATINSIGYDPIGIISPPTAGRYVASSGSSTGDAQDPALTFGTGSSAEIGVPTMVGFGGILVGIALLMTGIFGGRKPGRILSPEEQLPSPGSGPPSIVG